MPQNQRQKPEVWPLFFTDCDGNVVLASDPDDLAGDVVEASVLEKSAKAKENYHAHMVQVIPLKIYNHQEFTLFLL